MTYSVLVADDETASLKAIEILLNRNFPGIFHLQKCFNGKEALELIQEEIPDIVLTDIRMPVLDGIALAKQIQLMEKPPITVIISGYSDFTYAQSAIKYGVSDYLLKPIDKDEFVILINKLIEILKKRFYEEKKILLKRLCAEQEVTENEIYKYFTHHAYQLALVRYGGLPIRFPQFRNKEIFSEPEDLIFTYGRDDRELLYICSEKIFENQEFSEIIQKKAQKGIGESLYYTLIIQPSSVPPTDFAANIKKLYQLLLQNTVIGKNTIVHVPKNNAVCSKQQEKADLTFLEKLCAEGNSFKIGKEIERLLNFEYEQSYSQLQMEELLYHIQYLLKKYHLYEEKEHSEESFLFEDAFYNSENIEQLTEYVHDLFLGNTASSVAEKLDSKEYFTKISCYIETHYQENLTLQSICRALGISQAYLSKIMRKYGNETFKSCVTRIRLEHAKKIMNENNPQIKVKDIAEQSGFHDQFQFSKIFRAYTGFSPSEYLDSLGNIS